jgi:hypothetical protein
MKKTDILISSLSEEGHKWVKMFGSELIDQVGFRDSFLLIGQKGLKQGYAIESVSLFHCL